jgi:hypothetical protein
MAFATERDKVGVIQQGLSSLFWTEYLLPMLQDKAKNALTALATKAAEDDDVKRGRFQAYQDIINAPGRDVQAFNEQEAAAQRANADEQTAEYRADYGFRSPIRQAPEVGETTGEAGNAA